MKLNRILAVSAGVMLMSSAAMAQTVGIGTTKGGFTNQMGQALSKVVSQKTDLQMRSQPFGGSSVYVPAMDAGQLEFCLVNELEAYYAVSGTGIYDKKHPNIRVVSTTIPFRNGIYVRADSDIKTMGDLKGKRVPGGWASQRIIQPLMEGNLANAGLDYAKDVTQVPAPNVVKGADDFAAGKTDAFLFVFGAGKVRETAAKVGGLRVLPFSIEPGPLAAARAAVPPAFGFPVSPSKANIGVDKDMHVMAYYHTLAAGADVSEDTVYKVVKALHDNTADLSKAVPAMRLFKPENMAINFKGLEYHPGAIKFYKEKGMWPPKS